MILKKFCLILITSVIYLSSCQAQENVINVAYMSEPCLIPIKGNRFKTCDNMIVHVDDEYHVVPRGFKTDLASIPRILWPVFSPGDYDVIAPAVLHDWYYCCVKEVSRKKADDVFYYSLIWHGMGWPKAYLYYLAVRAGGESSYKHGEAMKEHEGQFDVAELQGVYSDVNFGLV